MTNHSSIIFLHIIICDCIPLSGKKLIGKPFITDSNQIYCGDQVRSEKYTIHIELVRNTFSSRLSVNKIMRRIHAQYQF